MSQLLKTLGKRIKSARNEKGISQEELAYRVDLHQTYIGQIERGEKAASLESLEKITKALGIMLVDLFKPVSATEKENSHVLSQINRRIQNLTIDEQKRILKLIDLVLEWK